MVEAPNGVTDFGEFSQDHVDENGPQTPEKGSVVVSEEWKSPGLKDPESWATGFVSGRGSRCHVHTLSLRFYLASAAGDQAHVAVLKRRIGDHHAAHSRGRWMLVSGWLIEIEAAAAA